MFLGKISHVENVVDVEDIAVVPEASVQTEAVVAEKAESVTA